MGPMLLVVSLLLGGSALVLMTLQPKATAAPAAISTTLSSSEITVGGSVYDTATLTGVPYQAGSAVTYHIFDSGGCTGLEMVNPTLADGLVQYVGVGPVVPPSSSETYNSAGSYSWNAAYSGGLTSSCEPLKVDKAVPSLSITLSANHTTVETSVNAIAKLYSYSVNAGGTVQYEYFPGNYCQDRNSSVGLPLGVTKGSVPVSSVAQFVSAGNYSWNAVYSGDGNNTGTTSPCRTLVVFPASVEVKPGLVAVAGGSTSIVVGGSLAFSATLSHATPNAGGNVTYLYFSGKSCLGSATQVGSPVKVYGATVPPSAPQKFNSAGTHRYVAVYSGDSNNAGATSSCAPFSVDAASPTINLTLSSTSIAPNANNFSMLATLSGGFHPTGYVSFSRYLGGVCTTSTFIEKLGQPVQVINNAASEGWIPASPGNYSIEAAYSGDNNNNPYPSLCESLTVHGGSVSISIELSSYSIDVRAPVTVTATLSGTTGSSGGKVTFESFSGSFCSGTPTTVTTVSVTSKTASVTSRQFPSAGDYSWKAVYSSPNTASSGATSPCKQLTVVGAVAYTDISVSCTKDSVVVSASAQTTCTATVSGTRSSSPSGEVRWSINGSGSFSKTDTCTLPNKNESTKSCNVKVQFTAAGPLLLTARYEGNSKNTASSSLPLTLTATATQSKISVSCSSKTVPVASSSGKVTTVKCTATVRGFDLTGASVAWTASGAGSAPGSVSLSSTTCTLLKKGSCLVTLTGITAGTVTVQGSYAGDPNNVGSSKNYTLTVTEAKPRK